MNSTRLTCPLGPARQETLSFNVFISIHRFRLCGEDIV